jgi:predicted outer membrane repeat protein
VHRKHLLFVLPMILAFLALFLGYPLVAQAATVIYVDADAIGLGNGSSWEDAYPDLQTALSVAASSDEIWVAEGIYYPDEGFGQTNDDIVSTFVLTDGVALYGGFDPGSGVDEMAERDWETNVTVLSGDIDHETNPDATDPHGVVTDTANIAGNNAYHVVYSDNVTDTALVDGFFITAGQANGSLPDNQGGGMYNRWHSAPTLSNVVFSGNSAGSGGGMFNWYHSDPTLTNVTFSANSADGGGGMGNSNRSNPRLTNVTFSSNSATDGGGMSGDGNPALTDVTFSGNTADRGGGMRISSGNPMMMNVTFSGNSATLAGGGMHTSGSQFTLTNGTFSGNSSQNGGGMYNNGSNFTLTNVSFSGNSAFFDGGGIRNYNCDPTLKNVNFSSNSAGWSGGGMYSFFYSDPSLTNVNFSGNSAGQNGGGMYNGGGGEANYTGDTALTNVIFSGNLASFSGGGMVNHNNNPALTNVTFSGNSADNGGGMVNWHNSSPTLTNVILWGNTANSGSQIYNDNGAPVIGYSDIQGSGGSGSWDPALGTDGGNNIDDNPLFVRDPDPGPDGNWDGVDDDYGDLHLQSSSPAIDSGTNSDCPATDLDGALRPFNGVCDMGAYEYGAPLPVSTIDINYDSGAPGSFFTLSGSHFPPNDIATISVNGTALGTIPTDVSGNFSFLLSTTNADEGTYFITASVNPSATVQFILSSDKPTWPQEGSGTVIELPAGIAYTESIFLPMIMRE